MSNQRSRDELVRDIGSRLARDGAAYGFTIDLYVTLEPDDDPPTETLWVDIDGTSTGGYDCGLDPKPGAELGIAEWVQDNVFDDMRISSWPDCPTHQGEPMIPGMFLGDPEPYWVCHRDHEVRIPIGSHPGAAPH
jgi:hypothetical protein